MFAVDVMFAVVLPFALAGALVLYIGAKDSESRRQQQELGIDSLRTMHRRLPRHDPREDSLKTREDSIHFYEDGF